MLIATLVVGRSTICPYRKANSDKQPVALLTISIARLAQVCLSLTSRTLNLHDFCTFDSRNRHPGVGHRLIWNCWSAMYSTKFTWRHYLLAKIIVLFTIGTFKCITKTRQQCCGQLYLWHIRESGVLSFSNVLNLNHQMA